MTTRAVDVDVDTDFLVFVFVSAVQVIIHLKRVVLIDEPHRSSETSGTVGLTTQIAEAAESEAEKGEGGAAFEASTRGGVIF